jgi:hypothetical protein
MRGVDHLIAACVRMSACVRAGRVGVMTLTRFVQVAFQYKVGVGLHYSTRHSLDSLQNEAAVAVAAATDA